MIKQILNWRMLVVLLMGFSSGVPLLLTGSTLKAWMTKADIDLTLIGFTSILGLPYTLKFLWAPLIDWIEIPFFGRRRGWLLVSQALLIISIALLGLSNPKENLVLFAGLAFLVALFSATQDIIIDAYRREILETEELGLGSSLAVNGYYVGILFAGGFALYLADHMSWTSVYFAMAASILVGTATVLFAPEPKVSRPPRLPLAKACIEPIKEFLSRERALTILAFILLYKLGDSMASQMTMSLYIKLGFSLTEIGTIVKGIGFWATIGGGLLGGVLILRLGINRALWIFGGLQAASTMGFAILAGYGMNLYVLSGVIGFENITAGMGTAAFSGFMASQTNKQFTATQYALLSSLMGVPRVFLGTPTGWMIKVMGWEGFFIFCTVIALPGMLLLLKVAPWGTNAEQPEVPEAKTAGSLEGVEKAL